MNVFCPSCGHRFDTVPPPHDPDGVVSCPKCLSTFATSGLAAPPPAEPRRKLKKKPARGFPVGPVVAGGQHRDEAGGDGADGEALGRLLLELAPRLGRRR